MPHKRAKRSIRETATAARGYDNAPTAHDSFSVPFPVPSTSSTPVPIVKPAKKAKKLESKDDLNSFGGRKDLGGMSKSMHRIINSVATREEYHLKKKRAREEEEQASLKKNPSNKGLVPLPYESLGAFNRRVETTLRPSIDIAIKASKSANKKRSAKKPKLEDPAVAADALIAGKDPKGKGKETIDPHIPKPKPQIVRNGPTEFQRPTQIKNITDVAMAPPTLKKRRDFNASMADPLPSHRMPVSDSIRLAMEREREKAVHNYRVLKEKREKEQREEQA